MYDTLRLRRWLAVVFTGALGAVSVTRDASANCDSGADYLATTKGNTVQVLPEGTARKCGGPIPMVRQDVATGDVVALSDYCVTGHYVDECVPPGTYRYGFATAYDCNEHGCAGVQYYAVATVRETTGACTLSPGNTAPSPYSAVVPWASSSSSLRECPSGCGCGAPGRGALGFDGVLVGISLVCLWRRRRTSRLP